MKERYIDLMEQALSAYSDERIKRYFDDVKREGLTEHGFPRLTSNIGILISHGRRVDLLPIFLEMMEFCCKVIPTVKAANDFSVREIICCLWEVEGSGIVSKENTERWRGYLKTIEVTTCYNVFATSPTDDVRNWAIFTAVSEYFRQKADLCDSADFVELQLIQQIRWLDENGMYQDNSSSTTKQPIMYDLVSRCLFCLIFDMGYRSDSYSVIDEGLKKAGLLTLGMQSPNGEIAFGGRSNQFLLCEAWTAAIYEYEAKRYKKEGNSELSATFKSAAVRALDNIEEWLSKKPILHIKNRFPLETKFGCEGYGYFDKYMITVASNLYGAYLLCDDSIPFTFKQNHEPCVTVTSDAFHKLFLRSGGYGLEFDINADLGYDANGLGRVQRENAPSTICMSLPCPSRPKYTVDINEPIAMSLCSAVRTEDGWSFGAEETSKYSVLETATDKNCASASLHCLFENKKSTEEHYTVNEDGVSVKVKGDGDIAYALPAFCFDGETSPVIISDEHSLAVSYCGWICRYTTDGTVTDLNRIAANRNGHYRVFLASAQNELNVKIEIIKEQI